MPAYRRKIVCSQCRGLGTVMEKNTASKIETVMCPQCRGQKTIDVLVPDYIPVAYDRPEDRK